MVGTKAYFMHKLAYKFLLPIYFLVMLGFAIYSYSQIDLNLTLSSNQIYQVIQNKLIFLGYYQRHLSSAIYLFLTILLYSIYLLLLNISKIQSHKFDRLIKRLIFLNMFFALISYPAFSHDFFNYLFDSRILTNYHLNPYEYSAQDFPDDLWVRFMHWTHRTYPYGPLWLLATAPFTLLGFGKFVWTLFLFKAMFALVYYYNCLLIGKIAAKINKSYKYFSIVFYSMNPLIIIETLISPHNESLMLLFLLVSFHQLFVANKYFSSLFWLTASILVKFATGILLPFYLIKAKIPKINNFFILSFILMTIPLIIQISNREAYAWYLVPILGIASLIHIENINIFIISISFGALLRYAPYLYLGVYSDELYYWMNLLLFLPLFILLILKITKFAFNKSKTNNKQ